MTPFIGEIRPFAFDYAPSGWAFCDGKIMNVQDNPALFSILGMQYGGDGMRTFGLPDLRETKVGLDGIRCVVVSFCISLQGAFPMRPR